MNKPSECTLVYIEERETENRSPYEEEHLLKVRCWDKGTFGSGYYVNRNRDMQASANLEIQTRYISDYKNGQLRYVDYSGKRYRINNFLRANMDSRRILDIQEDKI